MKKFAAFFAVVVLIAVAAPVFAATNPFMDVPMNSWAYDAVAQLASRGILSGYPDGLYRGRQPMTRYEAASMVARSLAVVDLTKASKQDVDMLKRLVVEFKDELDALGVRVDALDKDMALMKSRLGGWQMNGRFRVDVEYRTRSDGVAVAMKDGGNGTSMGHMALGDARVRMQRNFEDGGFVNVEFRGRSDTVRTTNSGAYAPTIDYFYATIPFLYDSFLTLGFTGDDEMDRRFDFVADMTARYRSLSLFNDSKTPRIILRKAFEYGDFYGSVARSNIVRRQTATDNNNPPTWGDPGGDNFNAWEAYMNFNFRMNEQFGFGIGGHYLSTDDWTIKDGVTSGDTRPLMDSAFTGWFGVDFNFVQGASLHGIIYFQSKSAPHADWDTSANAWRVALNLSQDLLQFTSFYAEYGRMGEGFWARDGVFASSYVVADRDSLGNADWAGFAEINNGLAGVTLSHWKLGAAQQWTDKVRTWLFYVDGKGDGWDGSLRQYGIGIDYAYNPYTIFQLNYMRWETSGNGEKDHYGRIRFTTQVSF